VHPSEVEVSFLCDLELDEAAEEPPHVVGGDLHDVDGDGGQHEPQAHPVQEPSHQSYVTGYPAGLYSIQTISNHFYQA